MKCRNCQGEMFRVQIKTRDMVQLYERNPKMAQDAGFPVVITCIKCGHIVKAWIVNEQIKELLRKQENLVSAYKALVACFENLVERTKKRTWLDRLLGK